MVQSNDLAEQIRLLDARLRQAGERCPVGSLRHDECYLCQDVGNQNHHAGLTYQLSFLRRRLWESRQSFRKADPISLQP